jgi:hypothetical protein
VAPLSVPSLDWLANIAHIVVTNERKFFSDVMMNWTLARPDCIPTPARGNEKKIEFKWVDVLVSGQSILVNKSVILTFF